VEWRGEEEGCVSEENLKARDLLSRRASNPVINGDTKHSKPLGTE